MLNQQIDPQRLTRDDFEKHVDALQQAIAKHFDIHTQKKGKLRDVAAMTLFGFENGYQQALAHFKQAAEAMPLPESRIALPEEVTLLVRSDLSDVVVFGPAEYHYGTRTHGEFVHAVLDECQEWSESDETQDLMHHDADGRLVIDLSYSQIMRQLHHDYVLSDIEVQMPRIEKYGVAPAATPEGALDLLMDLCLVDEGTSASTVADLLTTIDNGDDGTETILITLRSKRLIEKRRDCEPVLDALIKRLNSDGEIAKGMQDAMSMIRLRTLLSELGRMRADHPYLLKTDKAAFWEALSELDPVAAQQIREAYDI